MKNLKSLYKAENVFKRSSYACSSFKKVWESFENTWARLEKTSNFEMF